MKRLLQFALFLVLTAVPASGGWILTNDQVGSGTSGTISTIAFANALTNPSTIVRHALALPGEEKSGVVPERVSGLVPAETKTGDAPGH